MYILTSYIHVYACIYIHVYMHMHVTILICAHVYICSLHVYVNILRRMIHTQRSSRSGACVSVCVSSCVCLCVCVCACACACACVSSQDRNDCITSGAMKDSLAALPFLVARQRR